MADGSAGERVNQVNIIRVTTSETMQIDHTLQPDKTYGTSAPAESGNGKKITSFQITSVTDHVGSRLSNDGGEDSADDLEDSHTEDISDMVELSTPKLNETSSGTEDGMFKTEEVFVTNAIPSPIIPAVGGQYGIAIVKAVPEEPVAVDEVKSGDKIPDSEAVITVPVSSNDAIMDELQVWKSKFKVVKIQRTEPYKKGRWECMDFVDQPASTLSSNPPAPVANLISDVQSKIEAGTVSVCTQMSSTPTVYPSMTSTGTTQVNPQQSIPNTNIPQGQQAMPAQMHHQSQVLMSQSMSAHPISHPSINLPQHPNATSQLPQHPNVTSQLSQHPNATSQLPQHPNAPSQLPQHPNIPSQLPQHPNAPTQLQHPSTHSQLPQQPNASSQLPQHPIAPSQLPQHPNASTQLPQIPNPASQLPQHSNPPTQLPQHPNPPAQHPNQPPLPQHPNQPQLPQHPTQPQLPQHPPQPQMSQLPNQTQLPQHPNQPQLPQHPNQPQLPQHPNQPQLPQHTTQSQLPQHPNQPQLPQHPNPPQLPQHPNPPQLPQHPNPPAQHPNQPPLQHPNQPQLPQHPNQPPLPQHPNQPQMQQPPHATQIPQQPPQMTQPMQLPQLPQHPVQTPQMPQMNSISQQTNTQSMAVPSSAVPIAQQTQVQNSIPHKPPSLDAGAVPTMSSSAVQTNLSQGSSVGEGAQLQQSTSGNHQTNQHKSLEYPSVNHHQKSHSTSHPEGNHVNHIGNSNEIALKETLAVVVSADDEKAGQEETESFQGLALALSGASQGSSWRCSSPRPTVPKTDSTQQAGNSASGSSAVAIDNKIEQAMDLVKSHLMFAVREEVDVLKERITELMDRISQLEYENTILRAQASQETLAQLGSKTTPTNS